MSGTGDLALDQLRLSRIGPLPLPHGAEGAGVQLTAARRQLVVGQLGRTRDALLPTNSLPTVFTP